VYILSAIRIAGVTTEFVADLAPNTLKTRTSLKPCSHYVCKLIFNSSHEANIMLMLQNPINTV
ncbi:hypothetical protein DOG58_24195, partial [Salmonella enterica]|nr:hypothetical protein [Salmonella enterica]